MISGGRTKQLDIFCRLTGFTGDFLSFVVVKLIQFFHGALQMVMEGVGAGKAGLFVLKVPLDINQLTI